jgi:Fe-S-cluster containining protein
MTGTRRSSRGTSRSVVWYREGLRFSCTRCGTCCSSGPGTVRVTDAEIQAIAAQLELTVAQFRGLYTRDVGDNDLSLREKLDYDCIFWDATNGCTVYEVRPRQCRTWPFWHANISSSSHWSAAARDCPGMNQGPTFSSDYIGSMSDQDGTLDSARRMRRTK